MTDFDLAPHIVSSFPQDNAEQVPVSTRQFTVTFNTDLDRSQIDNNVSVQTKDGIHVPVAVAYDHKVITFTLDPETQLKAGQVYSLSLKGDSSATDGLTVGLRSIFGKPMEGSFAIYFRTEAVMRPDVPVASSPVHLNAIKGRPVFAWSGQEGMRYEIEVSRQKMFEKIHWGNQYATSPATPNVAVEFPDGTYYWRLRAVDADGKASEWSMSYVFAVDSLELSPVVPTDTLPPEVEYDRLGEDQYVEFLDTFPLHEASNLKPTLKTLSFRVLGDIAAEDVSYSLFGESIFGEDADHGEVDCSIEAVPGDGFTTVYVTLPILA